MATHKETYTIFKRGRVYYYRLGDDPSRTPHSTGVTSRVKADAYVRDLLKQETELTLGEYAEPFYTDRCPHLARLRAEKKNPSVEHIKSRRSLLERFILHAPIAKIPLRNLKRGHINDFRASMVSKYSDGQINRVTGVLKTVLKEAYYREDIDRDPTQGIGVIRVDYQPRGTFSDEEIDRIISWDEFDGRQRMAFLLAAETGMRRGEVLGLQWGDVDFFKHVITVNRAQTPSGDKLPKWGHVRYVPLTSRLEDELRQFAGAVETNKPDDYVIAWDDGTRVNYRSFQRWCELVLDKLGLDRKGRRLSLHSFRHTKVTQLKEAGVPDEVVQAMVGHTDKEVTARYTHWQPEFLVDAVRQAEPSN